MRTYPLILSLAFILAAASTAIAADNRCGWIENPTPGNYWLDDRDGSWMLLAQGSDQEPLGMENMPDFSAGDFVETNGYYGYACGCMKVETERSSDFGDSFVGRVTAIYSFMQLPISKCRNDKTLPKPE
ncbi:hypothetical protein ASE36_09805 [Rhizobium sp. Root274]|uniref:DUF4087 domain-containing protein n=1 Tax=unclassified Rhizobium TaxID=2613769 RepID=UPI0007146CFC|nr:MULTISPECIES: DUF4087 domain-containing protein [unclassified Rhizobium]KQW28779.1 hypothetical protein ASC71_09820 [Rhizobium sp. Root1240]KRD28975.1 hypothetical protein ASE36_09805 [Rhizobium sp. Root274]